MTAVTPPSTPLAPNPLASTEGALILALTATAVERRIIQSWLDEQGFGAVQTMHVDSRPGDDAAELGARLAAMTADGRDPQLAPVRVAWLPRQRDGRRSARLRDVLRLSDPYHPRAQHQQRLVSREPDRYQVVLADTASVSEVRDRFLGRAADDARSDSEFGRFVVRQCVLSLERAESRRFGERRKLPRLVREEILASTRFRDGIARLAADSQRPEAEVIAEANEYLEEMVATPSRRIVDIGVQFARLCNRQAYGDNLNYDRAELERLRELSRRAPIALLPSHRSYLDYAVLASVLEEADLPPTAGLGGINLAFWPVGSLLRRAGMVFIRRNIRDNAVYKFVLRQYVGYLAEKRFSLMWSIEGTRTRTGKLGPPKMGLLAYVAGAFVDGRSEDYYLIPLSITYEELLDVEEHGTYASGRPKTAESLSWFVRYIRAQRRDYRNSQVHIGFGEPVSLRESLTAAGSESDASLDDDSLALQKAAFEVAVRINQATPLTTSALVAMVLLGARRAMTVTQLLGALAVMDRFAQARDLPRSSSARTVSTVEDVSAALTALRRHNVVRAYEGRGETVFGVAPGAELSAAYYRNSIVHFFVTPALCELALLAVLESPDGVEGPVAFWAEIEALRDLLKFEFFFPEKAQFRDEVKAELGRHTADWERAVNGTREDIEAVVDDFSPLSSPLILRPYLDAYAVLADVLAGWGSGTLAEDTVLLRECRARAAQLVAQRYVRSPESASDFIFRNALRFARHRGLLEPHDEHSTEARQEWNRQMRVVLRRARVVERWSDSRLRAALRDDHVDPGADEVG